MSKCGTLLMAGGGLLIAAALSLTVYNLWDEQRADSAAVTVLEQLRPEIQTVDTEAERLVSEAPGETVIPDYQLNPKMDMPTVCIDKEDYIGVLYIPALQLELPVMSEWSYPRLKTAPCRYQGSVYRDDLIIAAHNYDRHFGKLKELSAGDKVSFTDTDGNAFYYEVEEIEVLGKTEVEEMKTGEWELTLFTCTVGGENRITVRCGRADG